jgi:hypothetical protein
MIRHIIFFKLKKEHKASIAALKKQLDGLKQHIPEIKHLETGLNFSERDIAYDLSLIVDVATTNDLMAYQQHPEHQKIVDFIKNIAEQKAVVDYEIA